MTKKIFYYLTAVKLIFENCRSPYRFSKKIARYFIMSYTCYHHGYHYYDPLRVVLYHITTGRLAANKTFGFSSLTNYLK